MKTSIFKYISASIIGLHISFLLMSQSIKVGMGSGVSSYFGDLTYTKQLFQQVSPSVSTDISVDLNSRFGLRLNIAYTPVQADDKKSIYWPTRNRNLNFKSDILEISTLAEFDIFKAENVMVTPYLFAGPGVFFFNPTTIDRYGNKVDLKYVGTEGQPGTIALTGEGSSMAEGTKMPIKSSKAYETNALCLISGVGFRVQVSELFSIGAEFTYRLTNTDMLDDVSANQYPNKSLMNPYAYKLTFREDEIHPNAQPGYQPRGNPLIKDSYYSVQIRVTYQLN